MHGYSGAGALFFKLLKRLSRNFRVICVDLIGAGSSSRPDDYPHGQGFDKCIQYFNDYFEMWR